MYKEVRMKTIEKHELEYSCGCKSEIELYEGGGFWKGNVNKCTH